MTNRKAARPMSKPISEKPMNAFQWLMVAICFILNFNDGIDVLLVSYAGPEIIREWDLSKEEMGYIFSAGLAGMTLGCFFIAPIADVIGRRKIFLISVSLIVVGLFGVGMSHSYALVLILRFITGLGLGGILPTMTATAAEFSNEKYRDFNVGLVQAGWPIGAILTGWLSARYIPVYGWHAAFLVAGGLALLMWLMVFFFMTDSLEFLENNSVKVGLAKINHLRSKLQLPPIKELSQKSTGLKPGLKTLMSTSYKSNTFRIWIAAFFGFMTLYTLMSWIPTIAKEAGLSYESATWVGIMLNIGAALGSASIGALGSKLGLRQVQLAFMLLAFLLMQIYAFADLTYTLIFILVTLIGVFVQGGFNGIWPILSRLYESSVRTTGVGYTVGIGRLGAVLGPWLFGFLSDAGWSIRSLFVLFSVPLLVMGMAVRSLKSKNL